MAERRQCDSEPLSDGTETMTKIDSAAIQAERAVYERIGKGLLEMLHEEHMASWKEVLLHVDHVHVAGSPEAFVAETRVAFENGKDFLLVARPNILALSGELYRLCEEQSGMTWSSFDFRLYRGSRGPAFQCRYTYPETLH